MSREEGLDAMVNEGRSCGSGGDFLFKEARSQASAYLGKVFAPFFVNSMRQLLLCEREYPWLFISPIFFCFSG